MLAFMVGVGAGLYSYGAGGIMGSISSVFNNAGLLLEEASAKRLSVASFSDDIISRLADGRYQNLSDMLEGNPARGTVTDIDSDSAAGQELAQKLNIQTKNGDGWFARTISDGTFVVSYYSAADNKGITFSQLKNDYVNNTGKYYQPDKEKTSQYPMKVTINEGLYNSTGSLLYKGTTTGHIEPARSEGEVMSIYPGSY